MTKTPSIKVLESLRLTIQQSGVKRIKTRELLRLFGHKKRSAGNVESINDWLGEQGIYTYRFELNEGELDSSVDLSDHPMTKLGRMVDKEKQLMDRFVVEIMPQLGLRSPNRDHSPKGTRDRFDFLCEDCNGTQVVVELKRWSGEKHGVEQVMRYLGLLKSAGIDKDPRGILITGYADPHTRRALEGREKDAHISWYVYGIRDDKVHLEEVIIGSRTLPLRKEKEEFPSSPRRNPDSSRPAKISGKAAKSSSAGGDAKGRTRKNAFTF